MQLRLTAIIVGVLLSVFILTSCGGDDPTATPVPPTATSVTQPTAEELFALEWEELIVAAQAEGELVTMLSSSSGRTFQPVVARFEELFGIDTLNIEGRSRAEGERVMAEQQANRFTVDLASGGTGTALRMLALDSYEPIEPWLIHPALTDPSLWKDGHYWWHGPDEGFILIYSVEWRGDPVYVNTDLLPAATLDTSVLIDPQWKGMVAEAINPALEDLSTASIARFYFSQEGRDLVETYWKTMEVQIVPDDKIRLDRLARGAYAFVRGAGQNVEEDVLEMAALGLPVAFRNLEGFGGWRTGSDGSIGVLRNPPHPNAAKLFLNWWLSPDGWADSIDIRREASKTGFIQQVPLHTGNTNPLLPAGHPSPDSPDFVFPFADRDFEARAAEGQQWFKDLVSSQGY